MIGTLQTKLTTHDAYPPSTDRSTPFSRAVELCRFGSKLIDVASYPPCRIPAPWLRTHGPVAMHQYRCCSLREDGTVHSACSLGLFSCQVDRSIEKRPSCCMLANSGLVESERTAYSPLLGAHTMAILSGIMTWYPQCVCRSLELMKHVCVGCVWIQPSTIRSSPST